MDAKLPDVMTTYPFCVEAPTAIDDLTDAGEVSHAFILLLPAATLSKVVTEIATMSATASNVHNASAE